MSEKFDVLIQDLDIIEVAHIRTALNAQYHDAFIKLLDHDLNETDRRRYQSKYDTLYKVLLALQQIPVERRIEQSWKDNPDRQGGQFTQEEMDQGKWI